MRDALIWPMAVAAAYVGVAGSVAVGGPAVAGAMPSPPSPSHPYEVLPVVNAPLPDSHEAFVEITIANMASRAAKDVRLRFYTQSSGGAPHTVVPGLPAQPPISGLPPISPRPHLRGNLVDLGRVAKGQHFNAGFTLPCLPNMHLELRAGSKRWNVSQQASLNAMLKEVC